MTESPAVAGGAADDVTARVTGLLDYVIRLLVANHEQIAIAPSSLEDGLLFEIRVAPDELGRLIGRRGKTVRALRSVAQAAGAKLAARVNVEIVD